jgi:hypothetical protein
MKNSIVEVLNAFTAYRAGIVPGLTVDYPPARVIKLFCLTACFVLVIMAVRFR